METRWLDYKTALIARYGEPIYRLGIDGGFSCPNRATDRSGGCIYCDSKGSAAAYQRMQESQYHRDSVFVPDIDTTKAPPHALTVDERKASILKQIERGRVFLDSRYHAGGRSLYFQAFTNTFGPLEEIKELYDCALATGSYRELIISTRPDCLNASVVSLLASYRKQVDEVWVELGLQSGNDDTLKRIRRGHSVEDFRNACHRLRDAGLQVSAHIILGLPGESYAHIERTASVIAQVHPQAIKIHNLHVMAGTALYEEYVKGEFTVPSMERHMSETIFLLRRIPADIIIQRFVSDSPSHRLAAPRNFGDKGVFVSRLREEMERCSVAQGDLV